MVTPSSSAIIAASRDEDLLERLKALGALRGYTPYEVEAIWSKVLVAPVDEEGVSTIASVYEYASVDYSNKLAAMPPKPGLNPAAVTDDHLLFALDSLKAEEATATE